MFRHKFGIGRLFTLCVIVATVSGTVCKAANVNWDDGGAGKLWSIISNWQPNAVPGSGDDVFIGNLAAASGDATLINQDFSIGSLTLSGGASANTLMNRLTMNGPLSIGLASDFILPEHAAGSGTASLQIVGDIDVSNLGEFRLEGGYARIGGAVDVNLGGEFGGYGDFQFVNGLNGVQTLFTNNGSLKTGRAAGAAATERFRLQLRANDTDARIDLDGVNNNRVVNLVENTTLDIDMRLAAFSGAMTMDPGTILGLTDNLEFTGGGRLIVDASSATGGVQDTATIRGATVSLNTGSTIEVNSGTLIFDADYSGNSQTAQVHLAARTGLVFNGTADVNQMSLAVMSHVTVNGDATLRADLDDLSGALGTATLNVGNGGQLSLPSSTGVYSGTLNVNGGVVDFANGRVDVGANGKLVMNGAGSVSRLVGAPVDLRGELRATGGGTSRVDNPLVFLADSSSIVESGSDLFINASVNFLGGSNHTGAGDLLLGGNLTVVGDTVINMPNGRVEVDSSNNNRSLQVNRDLTINAVSLRNDIGRVDRGSYTVNIDNTDSTFEVNLAGSNDWTLGPEGIVNIDGLATLQTSIAGSPLNVNGTINVNNSTRFSARVDIESGGAIELATGTLHLDGGNASEPNQINDGTIAGAAGTLSSLDSGLRGHGIVAPRIFFNGSSDVIAERGTLRILNEVVRADIVGAVSGATINLFQALDTSDVTALQLTGGAVTGGIVNNLGITRGFGTINTVGFDNESQLLSSGNGTLILDTLNAPDIDGTSNDGIISAMGGNLTIVDAIADAFDGRALVGTGHVLELQQPWEMGAAGRLSMTGNAVTPATLLGEIVRIDGQINIGGQSVFEAPALFRAGSQVSLPASSDTLRFRSGVTINPDVVFSGDGNVVLEDGLNAIISGAVIDVAVRNEATIGPTSAGDPVHLRSFEQTATGSLGFRLDGTNVGEYTQFIVDENVALDGGLQVVLDPAFTPAVDDSFLLLQATTGFVTGRFGLATLPTLQGGLEWQVDYSDPLTVWLRVVGDFGTNGDFDGNGDYACNDIDALVAEIVGGANSASFDLTGDGLVNGADLDSWLAEAGAAELSSGNPYLYGDANLDGSVDVSDFNIWNGNKFAPVSAWCAGDFNHDGSVDVSDFNIWNGNKFQSSDQLTSVPEPGAELLILLGMLAGSCVRKRRICQVA